MDPQHAQNVMSDDPPERIIFNLGSNEGDYTKRPGNRSEQSEEHKTDFLLIQTIQQGGSNEGNSR